MTTKLGWARWAQTQIIHYVGNSAVDLAHLAFVVASGGTVAQYIQKAIVNVILDRNRRQYDSLTVSPTITIYHAPCAFGKSTTWQLFLQLANLRSNVPHIIPQNFYIGQGSLVGVVIILSAFAIPCTTIASRLVRKFWSGWSGVSTLAPYLKALHAFQIVTREQLLHQNKVSVLRKFVKNGHARIITACSQSFQSITDALEILNIPVKLVIVTEVADVTEMHYDGDVLLKEFFTRLVKLEVPVFLETANKPETTMFTLLQNDPAMKQPGTHPVVRLFEAVTLRKSDLTPFLCHSIADMLGACLHAWYNDECQGVLILSNGKNIMKEWALNLEVLGFNICDSIFPTDDIVPDQPNALFITGDTDAAWKAGFMDHIDTFFENFYSINPNGVVFVCVSSEMQGTNMKVLNKDIMYGVSATRPDDTHEHVVQMIARFRNGLECNGILPSCFVGASVAPVGVILFALSTVFTEASAEIMEMVALPPIITHPPISGNSTAGFGVYRLASRCINGGGMHCGTGTFTGGTAIPAVWHFVTGTPPAPTADFGRSVYSLYKEAAKVHHTARLLREIINGCEAHQMTTNFLNVVDGFKIDVAALPNEEKEFYYRIKAQDYPGAHNTASYFKQKWQVKAAPQFSPSDTGCGSATAIPDMTNAMLNDTTSNIMVIQDGINGDHSMMRKDTVHYNTVAFAWKTFVLVLLGSGAFNILPSAQMHGFCQSLYNACVVQNPTVYTQGASQFLNLVIFLFHTSGVAKEHSAFIHAHDADSLLSAQFALLLALFGIIGHATGMMTADGSSTFNMFHLFRLPIHIVRTDPTFKMELPFFHSFNQRQTPMGGFAPAGSKSAVEWIVTQLIPLGVLAQLLTFDSIPSEFVANLMDDLDHHGKRSVTLEDCFTLVSEVIMGLFGIPCLWRSSARGNWQRTKIYKQYVENAENFGLGTGDSRASSSGGRMSEAITKKIQMIEAAFGLTIAALLFQNISTSMAPQLRNVFSILSANGYEHLDWLLCLVPYAHYTAMGMGYLANIGRGLGYNTPFELILPDIVGMMVHVRSVLPGQKKKWQSGAERSVSLNQHTVIEVTSKDLLHLSAIPRSAQVNCFFLHGDLEKITAIAERRFRAELPKDIWGEVVSRTVKSFCIVFPNGKSFNISNLYNPITKRRIRMDMLLSPQGMANSPIMPPPAVYTHTIFPSVFREFQCINCNAVCYFKCYECSTMQCEECFSTKPPANKGIMPPYII